MWGAITVIGIFAYIATIVLVLMQIIKTFNLIPPRKRKSTSKLIKKVIAKPKRCPFEALLKKCIDENLDLVLISPVTHEKVTFTFSKYTWIRIKENNDKYFYTTRELIIYLKMLHPEIIAQD